MMELNQRKTSARPISTDNLLKIMHRHPLVPEQKLGDLSIVHETVPAGTPIEIVSMRNALFMGYRPWRIRLDVPIIIAKLKDKKHGVWMTDAPQELWQMEIAIRRLRGRALIGGLGLGVATYLALQRKQIEKVTTVERSRHVYQMVAPSAEPSHWRDKSEIILSDIFQFLSDLKPGRFDSAFLDTWQPTGEFAWTEHIVPLRRLCRGKIRNVVCWIEDEAANQMLSILHRVVDITRSDISMPPHYATIRDAARASGLRKRGKIGLNSSIDNALNIEQRNLGDPEVNLFVRKFLKPGTDSWERLFGEHWDRNFEAYKNRQKEREKNAEKKSSAHQAS